MNEYIEVRFRRGTKPLRVMRQLPCGIELDEADPIERTVYIGFDAANEITRYRMRRVRQLQGWSPTEFRLKMAVEDGSLVLRGVTPFALPQGRYTLRVRLEEASTREQTRTIDIAENGHAVSMVDVKTDDRGVAIDLDEADPAILRVVRASSVDGQDGLEWLADDRWRPTRKACLLNLLASLRERPARSAPLIEQIQHFYSVGNDRAYARVDRELLTRLEALATGRKPFYREGRPTAAIHKKLIESISPETRHLFDPDDLLSFRGEGSPSLQVVVATPPAGYTFTYAEFDLDLGNALQDVAGFVVHMGELLDGTPTNHLDLRKKLARSRASDFLYYTVQAA